VYTNLTHAKKDLVKLPFCIIEEYEGICLWYFIVTGIIDSTVSCNFIYSHPVTRENRYKLTQKHAD